MRDYPDAPGPLAPLPRLAHPTPAHVRSAIFERLSDLSASLPRPLPVEVWQAVRQGVADASHEFEEGML